jgi:predicted permease
MRSLRRLFSRLTWWVAASTRDQALLQAEIDEHIALQTADNIRAGLAPPEARRQALLKFGGVVSVQEAYRDQREPAFWRRLNGIWRDLAYAGRSLAKARAFTLVCVVSLGIGMAPVIAIPYASRVTRMAPPGVHTEQLVQLVTTSAGPHQESEQWSYPDYVDLRGADTGITLFAWIGAQSEVTIEGGASKVPASTMFVPANYFSTIGVPLARGAGFESTDDDPLNARPVVVVSYPFWQNRLRADPDIVGKTLTIDGAAHIVAGVAPDRFDGHIGFSNWELYAPLERHPALQIDISGSGENLRDDRAKEWLLIHGRLQPGVSVEQASAAVAGVTARLAKAYPATNEFKAGIAGAYDPLGILVRRQLRIIQAVAFTLTGMVLLVVALNISGMMQVRSAMRERELSIRQAIGATRSRLGQLLLAEAVLLAGLGGAAASVVLFNIHNAVPLLVGEPLPPQVQAGLDVSLSMIAVCIVLCLAVSLVFGFLPATRFSRPVIISALKDEAGAGGLRVGRVHRVTAALQVAIAVPLLVMGGISLDRVRSTATSSLGFDAERLYAAPLKLDTVSDRDARFQTRNLSDTLAQASGVAAVTVADGLPLDFRGRPARVALTVDSSVAPRWIVARVTRVGDGYLKTLGIPLLRGRGFTNDDGAGSEKVTIISKTLADKLFPDADGAEPIGKRLSYAVDGAGESATQTLTIVGVTADFPTSQMSSERQQLLVPLAQHAGIQRLSVPIGADVEATPATRGSHLLLIARSAPGEQPVKMVTAVEQVARQLDPDFQRTSIVTGAWLRKNSVNDFLTQSMVAGAAGGVILVLSALGIYGVVGLMVATRTREVAVRMALGATRRRVLGLIVFDVVKIVTPGIGVGLFLTAVLIRLNAENMGVSLSGIENLAYVAGGAIALLVAVIASLAPARRAASVPAMVAMRSL